MPMPCVPNRIDSLAWPGADANPYALGPLPAAYEVQAPAINQPLGVVMFWHGGGWIDVGTANIIEVRREATRWRARGWATCIPTYRGCSDSLNDALAAHDAVRSAIGAVAPIVTSGESSGAHLALMVALRRPTSVSLCVTRAAPTNRTLLATSPNGSPAKQLADGWASTGLPSPIDEVAQLRCPLLLVNASADTTVPINQATSMATAAQAARGASWGQLIQLPTGDGAAFFPHQYVDSVAEADYRAVEVSMALAAARKFPAPTFAPGWWQTLRYPGYPQSPPAAV